jgi:DNA repair protein RecO (recombination protein O)
MATLRRISKQPLYVLMRRPYSESSLVLDGFSRDFGRVPLLAKGARRLKSPYRGLLHAFTPLSVDWSGRRELVTLTRAEPLGAAHQLPGRALMCAWYASELLVRFLHRGDPHDALFDAYARLLDELARGEDSEWALRLFETALLFDVGYGLVLDREATGRLPIRSDGRYLYIKDRGPVAEGGEGLAGIPVGGEALIALREGICPRIEARREAKLLTRALLAGLLEGRLLKSREVFLQMYGRDSVNNDS